MNLELSGTSTKYDDDHETKSILRRVEEEKKVSVQFAAWGSSIMEFEKRGVKQSTRPEFII